MTGKSIHDIVKKRIQKSELAYHEAELLANFKMWSGVMSRLYYASFYLVTAWLSTQSVNPKSHNGTKAQFNLLCVKTGKIDIETARIFDRLFDYRMDSDYSDFATINEAEALELLQQAKEFNDAMKKLLLNNSI